MIRPNNKKKKYDLTIKLSGYIVIFLLTILFIEIISFSALSFYDLKQGDDLKQIILKRKIEIISATKKKSLFGNFDPLQQSYLPPGTLYGGKLLVNEHGFIKNKSNEKIVFPEKNEDMIRVILLGGSSVAGSGSSYTEETISSQLELMLNEWSKNNHNYQVLNFGFPGAYTGSELVKFNLNLIHLKPDIVVTIDGFNDAWNVIFEKERTLIEHPIINWSDLSYKYFETFNGYHSSKNINKPIVFVPYSSTLLFKIVNRIEEKRVNKETKIKFYKKYPLYNFSKFIYDNDKYHLSILEKNLESFASRTCREDYIYIGTLQPHAYDFYENLNNSEKEKLNIFELKYKDTIKSKENYINEFNSIYNKYKKIYKNLNDKYLDCQNVRFKDLTNIFDDHKKDVYVDNIHYTPHGNKIIAKNLFKILINLK